MSRDYQLQTASSSQSVGIEERPLPSIRVLRMERTFCHQKNMRIFIIAALCEPDKSCVVSKLVAEGRRGDYPGLLRLREILQADFSIDAGNLPIAVSFQRVAIPFCELFSDEDLICSVQVGNVGTILQVIYSERKFLMHSVFLCLQEIHSRRSVKDLKFCSTNMDRGTYVPETLLDVVQPVVRLVLAIIIRVVDADLDEEWPKILALCHSMLDRGRPSQDERRRKAILIDLKHCQSVLEKPVRMVSRMIEDSPGTAETRALHGLCSSAGSTLLRSDPYPGVLKSGGPCHDNDSEDFRKISVLPTEAEMMSTEPPYLPHQAGPLQQRSSAFVIDPVDRHLDIQFRLTREDMIAPVRRALQHFILGNVLAELPEESDFFECEDQTGQKSICHVYHKVMVEKLVPRLSRGCTFDVQFRKPNALRELSTKARDDFWVSGKGCRMLQPGSLLCIVFDASRSSDQTFHDASVENRYSGVDFYIKDNNEEGNVCGETEAAILTQVHPGNAKFVFATALPYGRDLLSAGLENTCHGLCLHPVNSNDTKQMISYMGKYPRSDEHEHVILEVKGHIISSYMPVLQGLQLRELSSHRMIDTLIREDGRQDEEACPSYLAPETCFDISFLTQLGNESEVSRETVSQLSSVPVSDYETLVKAIEGVSRYLALEKSQIYAFAAGISRKVALIQGPPGTGKTFIGVQIVRALLHNSSRGRNTCWTTADTSRKVLRHCEPERPQLDPILCVCFTNHALDSFLEELVESGAVEVEQVVRLGARSKSKRMMERTVSSLMHSTKGNPDSSRSFYRLKQKCKEMEEAIALNLDTISSIIRGKNPGQIRDFLERYQPKLLREINDSQLEEGYNVQGGFAAILRNWLNAADIANSHDQDIEKTALERGEFLHKTKKEWEVRIRETVMAQVMDYEKTAERIRQLNDGQVLGILQGASIVGCTTSAAAKYKPVLQALRPRVVICEEAGEVQESHVLNSLSKATEHLILIGDHMQLRPKCHEYFLSKDSGNGYDIDVSLFERLVSKGRMPVETLQVQRRMHPRIADLVRATLYPTLQDSNVVCKYPESPLGFRTPVWFYDHNEKESGGEDQSMSSWSNDFEADMICALVRYAIRQGYDENQIAVLTPYVGQLVLIRQALSAQKVHIYISGNDQKVLEEFLGQKELGDTEDTDSDKQQEEGNTDEDGWGNVVETVEGEVAASRITSLDKCVRVSTVDNFQGEEADIVIVSTVRCNDKGRVGFLKVSNRVNVMLTRARLGMYLFGSVQTILRNKDATLFHSAINFLKERGDIGSILPLACQSHGHHVDASRPDEIPRDGGCNVACEFRLSCGHACKRRCHPDNLNHVACQCTAACSRIIEQCGHPCQRLCSDECKCFKPIQHRFKCGHEKLLNCFETYSDELRCEVPVESEISSCGHKRTIRCWEKDLKVAVCTSNCGKVRECGHSCRRLCIECRADGNSCASRPCEEKCMNLLVCGHECGQAPCHSKSDCPPCEQRCANRCEHSLCSKECKFTCTPCIETCRWSCTCEKKYQCQLPCATPCERLPCDLRCSLLLSCGHRCPSVCGEPCPNRKYCVECAKANQPETKETRSLVVDILSFKTLSQLDLEHGEDSPIVVLPCGHAFTTETLDGQLELDQYYARGPNGKGWSKPLVLYNKNGIKPPRCSECRKLIYGVKRYGRVLKTAFLLSMRFKWTIALSSRVGSMNDEVAELLGKLGEEILGTQEKAKGAQLRRDVGFVRKRYESSLKRALIQGPALPLRDAEIRARNQVRSNSGSTLVRWLGAPTTVQVDIDELGMRVMFVSIRVTCLIKRLDKSEHCRKRLQMALTAAQEYFHNIEAVCVSDGMKTRLSYAKNTYAHGLLGAVDVIGRARRSASSDGEQASFCEALLSMQEDCMNWLERNISELDSTLVKSVGKARRAVTDIWHEVLTAEEKTRVVQAMRDPSNPATRNPALGGFGVTWYTCPRGHPFAVGECGVPVQNMNCPECDLPIGGSHSFSLGTRPWDT